MTDSNTMYEELSARADALIAESRRLISALNKEKRGTDEYNNILGQLEDLRAEGEEIKRLIAVQGELFRQETAERDAKFVRRRSLDHRKYRGAEVIAREAAARDALIRGYIPPEPQAGGSSASWNKPGPSTRRVNAEAAELGFFTAAGAAGDAGGGIQGPVRPAPTHLADRMDPMLARMRERLGFGSLDAARDSAWYDSAAARREMGRPLTTQDVFGGNVPLVTLTNLSPYAPDPSSERTEIENRMASDAGLMSPQGYDEGGYTRTYHPSLDRIARDKMILDRYNEFNRPKDRLELRPGTTMADVASTALDFTPVVGDVKATAETAEIMQDPNASQLDKAIALGLLGVSFVPFLGDAARKGAEYAPNLGRGLMAAMNTVMGYRNPHVPSVYQQAGRNRPPRSMTDAEYIAQRDANLPTDITSDEYGAMMANRGTLQDPAVQDYLLRGGFEPADMPSPGGNIVANQKQSVSPELWDAAILEEVLRRNPEFGTFMRHRNQKQRDALGPDFYIQQKELEDAFDRRYAERAATPMPEFVPFDEVVVPNPITPATARSLGSTTPSTPPVGPNAFIAGIRRKPSGLMEQVPDEADAILKEADDTVAEVAKRQSDAAAKSNPRGFDVDAIEELTDEWSRGNISNQEFRNRARDLNVRIGGTEKNVDLDPERVIFEQPDGTRVRGITKLLED